MWSAATRLSDRYLNTLLSRPTAAISKGGLKDACETQEIVAAPRQLSFPDVSTYTPFDIIRSVFCLTFASTAALADPNALRKGFALCLANPQPPPFIKLFVLGGEEVEQQAVVQAAVNHVTLPLPADVLGVSRGSSFMVLLDSVFVLDSP
jgi:hypothetical protein